MINAYITGANITVYQDSHDMIMEIYKILDDDININILSSIPPMRDVTEHIDLVTFSTMFSTRPLIKNFEALMKCDVLYVLQGYMSCVKIMGEVLLALNLNKTVVMVIPLWFDDRKSDYEFITVDRDEAIKSFESRNKFELIKYEE
ncbi:MAG: hypothetical protein N2B06_04855 [Clostridium sp.]